MERTNTSWGRSSAWPVILVVVAGMLLWMAGDVVAQGRRPCAEDVAKYCKDIQPGQGRMAQCLNEHENDLSAVCKEHIAQMQQRGRGVHEACRSDVQKLCKDVQPGQGRMAQCLNEHENDLSADCKEHIARMKQQGRGGHGACRDDVQKLCKDVRPGQGGIYQCLKEHESELSPSCRENMPVARGGK